MFSNLSKSFHKKNIENIAALSPLQEGILFHYLRDPESSMYLEQLGLDISGEIIGELFEKAWNFVFETNEMLRVVFRWEKVEKPVQIILKTHRLQPEYYDFSNIESTGKKKKLAEIEIIDRGKIFDLRQVPFRVTLCKIEDQKYRMIITNHHILYDGWSNGVVLKEFLTAYYTLSAGKELSTVFKTKYEEFIKWLHSQDKSQQEKFWKHYLENIDTRTELPIKTGKGEHIPGTDVSTFQTRFAGDMANQLKDFITRQKITLSTLFYCAWGQLLQKYCNSRDIVFGTTISGRSARITGIEDMVGLFINTIPLRVRTKPGDRINQLLSDVNKALREREEYESTPLVNIKEYSELDNREELFDSIVVIENYPLDSRLKQGIKKSHLSIDSYTMFEMTNYDLTLTILISDEIEVNFICRKETFIEASILRLFNHFTRIVKEIMTSPEKKISELEIISEDEKKQLLVEFNDTQREYPCDKTIHELIEEQVQGTPHRIALAGSRERNGAVQQITYQKLNEQANRLARQLIKQGIKTNSAVGIMMEQSVEMLIGILAVLKAGGVYLPIDPGYPGKRIVLMLTGSGASFLLTQRGVLERKSLDLIDQGQQLQVLTMEELTGLLEKGPVENLEPMAGPDDLIYIIFTSGSTGIPKGAGVYHRGFMNLMHWFVTDFGLHGNDTNLLLTSFSFDLTQKNFYASLLTGGTLCIPGFNYFDPGTLLEEIKKNRVTWINCTPSMFYMLVENEEAGEDKKLSSLRYVFLGGEPILVSKLMGWLESGGCRAEIVNTYGPTECTDICASYRIKEPGRFLEENVPVGKPVYNARLYVLDKDLQLLPIGIAGELAIGGAGVGIGYVNDDALTSRKFFHCSFTDGESPELLYLTGDRVKWRADGTIEFLSRMDFQVKVRGYRIEMGEIENRLLAGEGVAEAVVVAKEDTAGSNYLCAYVVPAPGKEVEPEELKKDLNRTLPDYMVPSVIVRLDKLPLNPNGKIDRKSLPEPEYAAEEEYTAPRDEIEEKLAGLWANVLGVEKGLIGIDANFFELGGHSLKVTALVMKIHRGFDVKIPMAKVFKTPRIRELAKYIKYIKSRDRDKIISLKPVEKREYYQLSSTQRRLYILQQMESGNTTSYNLTCVIPLEKEINTDKIVAVFRTLIARHESLRTSFEIVSEQPVQRIRDKIDFTLEYIEARDRQDEQETIANFERPFDLSLAPLMRVGLLKTVQGRYLLLFDMHHIITDGASQNILEREFRALYAGEELIPLKLNYKDFSHWQTGRVFRDLLKHQKASWMKEFPRDEELPVLNLPVDFPRPAVQSFAGSTVHFVFTETETRALRKLAKEIDGTLYMCILAVYTVWLSKLSGSQDIIVGTPIAARRLEDLENIVGMCANTLAMRNYPLGEKSGKEFFMQVKERTLNAFENQDYPFEDLVENLPVSRDISRNPVFDVMFNLMNRSDVSIDIPIVDDEDKNKYEHRRSIAKFDLNLAALDDNGACIHFILEYCTRLFKASTIERFIGYFRRIVTLLSQDPQIRLADLEIITEEEKRQILQDFNDTQYEYPDDRNLHELVEEQVEKTPDYTALDGCMKAGMPGGGHVTYRELNEKSDQLAGLLRGSGINADKIVGVLLKRSMELIIAILGILKAGAAYLPMDPDYPETRLEYMLTDSKAAALVTEATSIGEGESGLVGKWTGEKIFLDEMFAMPGLPLINRQPANDNLLLDSWLAYIIYTSGTTGKPKGVMIEHSSVVNFVLSQVRFFHITRFDRILQFSSICFDPSAEQIFIALSSGATLVLIDKDTLLDTNKFESFIASQCITHLHAVPSYLNNIDLKNCYWLQRIISGGDVCPVSLAKKLNRHCDFYNKYGPTETTITSIERKFTAAEIADGLLRLPVGNPVGNTVVYLLNQGMKLVPLGVTGELYIGGKGVARGYLNQPELTAHKFKRNTGHFPVTNYRLYRTGDLGRWLEDGNIEFLGRVDQQVKIRGFRIELGEIENLITAYEEIKETVVLTKKAKNRETHLCAYIVAPKQPDISDLRSYLSAHLPDFMVPTFFASVERIPLTPIGKIDRKALPEPELNTVNQYIAPRNEIEEKLAGLWADVLGVEKSLIGVNNNFFELGGHSLKATSMVMKIHRVFNVKLPLTMVFKKPGLGELAKHINGLSKEKYIWLQPVEKKEYYPLSSTQRRLFILQQMESGNTTSYNMPYVFPLEREINKERIETVFATLIARHESLRTSFGIITGEPVQRVHRRVDFAVESLDNGNGDLPAEQEQAMITGFERPFDLSRPPLLRVGLLKTAGEKYLLLLDMHHIITDGASQNTLEREFQALYTGEELPAARLFYKDYAQWQTGRIHRELIQQQKDFWVKEFSRDDELPVLNLPIDFPRPAVQSFEGNSLHFALTGTETRALRDLAGEIDGTLYMCTLAIFSVLLSKLSGSEDIIIGTPIAARRHADLEHIVGMFANTLAMRNYPSGGKTCKEFLLQVKERTLAAFENQEYPFEDLVENLSVPRDISRNPIFDVMFNLFNRPDDAVEIPFIDTGDVNKYEHRRSTAKFDLNLAALDNNEEHLHFNLEYCTKLFKASTIEKMIGYFRRLIALFSSNTAQRLADLEILSQEEKASVLEMSMGGEGSWDLDRTINEYFEDQVVKTPDCIALTAMGPPVTDSLSFRELNEKSNQLAGLLIERGVTPDTAVGVMVERSCEMIVSVLAVLKAGGAYLPIDEEYPDERKKYMLKDTGVKLLLTNHDGEQLCFPEARSGSGEIEIINIDDDSVYNRDSRNSIPAHNGSNLLYVIYTSGSTGKPKGVMLEHRNLVNLVMFQYKYTNLDFSSVLQFATISFDVSAQEIFSTLLAGGELSLLGKDTRKNLPDLFRVIENNQIKTLFLPTAFLMFIFKESDYAALMPACVRHIAAAGEKLIISDNLGRYLRANHVFLHNHYGPSETHVVTALTLDPRENIPGIPTIGKPIFNTGIYILDKNLHLLATGVPGELYIGGVQVGRGYWKKQQLTAERFITNPFVKGERLYKTGDYARQLPDGNIEFLGRIDHQVKIRGFRVELGEIERQLLLHNHINETVVLAREDNGDRYLCAYVVSGEEIEKTGVSDLKDFLSDKLPGYMIPAYFIRLDKLPLNQNGKVDRKALPAPEKGAAGQPGTDDTPKNSLEKKLIALWKTVLGVERLGVNDNFFDRGGHSLKATVLIAKIHKVFQVKLPFVEVFKQPTVRELARYLKNAVSDAYVSIRPVEEREYYDLSSTQTRLYLLQQQDKSSIAYNMPHLLLVEGEVNRDKIEDTFQKLVARHESLRTSFRVISGKPVQRILRATHKYPVTNFRQCPGLKQGQEKGQEPYGNDEGVTGIINRFIQPFDLSRAPLLRVKWVTLAETKQLLMVDMPHIITDGTSIGIFIREFMALQAGDELPPLEIRYKDCTGWQNSSARKEELEKESLFWETEFAPGIPALHLPLDYPRPAARSFAGNRLDFSIGKNETKKLEELANEQGATLFMVLLAIFYTLLYKISGQEDIVVGTPVVGRNHEDLNHIIGMFVNTLALRNYPEGEQSFLTFLGNVKDRVLSAFENQDYPFEDLVEQVKAANESENGRNPLFDVVFSMQNLDIPDIEIKGLKLSAYEYENFTTKFDLVLFSQEEGDSLECAFGYSTLLFKEETIEMLINNFNETVQAVIKNKEVKLQEISFSSDFIYAQTEMPQLDLGF